jgi:putative hydrolase
MTDDLFSKLFELFNQPGPVNWKLAAEVARHLTGDREPVEPWAAEEFRDLARLAEFKLEEVAPFRISAASDVLPLDQRGWAERNLETYTALVEPFAASVVSDGPAAGIFGQMTPAIIGLQAGSLVGSLASWVVAGFDAGLPPDRPGPMTLIVPNIAQLGVPDVDVHEVRLWVVANEVAFRSVCELPWIGDHLAVLVGALAEASRIDPSKLSGLMMGGADPADLERAVEEAGGIEGLLGGEEADAPRAELEAFFGTITGCARLLARRAIGSMSPNFDAITQARDRDREEMAGPVAPIGVGPVRPEVTRAGEEFNREVERRYGEGALGTLWTDPSRIPSAAELADPTAWAARVLLDGWN